MHCPHCGKDLTIVGAFQVCPEHGPVEPRAEASEPVKAPKVKLFLSYGRRDAADLADRLIADLEREGFEVWMDRSALRSGRGWEEQIKDGLRSTQIFIALLSPHAVRVGTAPNNPDASDSVCLDEISFARFNPPPKPIVPVMAVPCEPPLCIFRLDYVDMVAWQESEERYIAGFRRLLEALEEARQGKSRHRLWDNRLQPWDFAAFIHEKRRQFTGREWLFQELEQWLREGTEPALIIKGDPGAGKSAIVAELVHRNPGGRLLAYHCCLYDTPATLQPDRLVRSLAAMLASQLPDYARRLEDPEVQEVLSQEKCAEDPGSALEAGILNPLQNLHAPSQGVCYIIIDALDEALAKTGVGLTIVQLLASRLHRLPPWLRLVATSRQEPEVLDRLKGLRARELLAQDPRNLADLGAYLERRLGENRLATNLAASGVAPAAAGDILLAKSEGNFLYLRQALDGLEGEEYSFANLEELPPGLFGLYLGFFERAFPDETAFAQGRRVLQVMAAARESLTAAQLALFTGLDPEEELPRLLRRLAVYLPQQEGRYTFYHKSLADWLTAPEQQGSRYAISRRRGHQLLADWGWREYETGPDQISHYMLAHLSAHLAAAGRTEDLDRILWDYRWLRGKLTGLGVNTLIQDYDLLPENREMRLIQGALRLSAHVLSKDPEQLASQLLGRLMAFKAEPMQSFCREITASKNAEQKPWLRPLTASLAAPGGPLIKILMGHTGYINAVALTPDGRRALSGSRDNTLKLWDLETGEELRTLIGHTSSVGTVAVTPDGRWVVSGSNDGTLKVWDLETGQEFFTLIGHTGCVNAVAVSPDGSRAVSCSDDHTIKVWDLEKGQELCTLTGHTSGVKALALMPDGQGVVSGSADYTLNVWNLETGQVIRILTGHTDEVLVVTLTPDGHKAVSGSLDRTLKVWDLETGQELLTLTGHTGWVRALSVTPDSRWVVSGSGDKTLKIWDMETGQIIRTLTGHASIITAVAITPDGRCVVSGSMDKTLKVWDLDSGQGIHTITFHTEKIKSVALTPDGRRVVSGSDDKTVRVWDLETGQELYKLIGHTSGVWSLAISPDGHKAVSGSLDRTLKVWDLETGQEIRTLTGKAPIIYVAMTPDGRRAVSASFDDPVSYDELLKIWDLEVGQELCTLSGHTSMVRSLALTPDGHHAISGSFDGTLKVWDLTSGKEIRTLTGDTAYAVTLTQDGSWAVSGGADRTLRVWDFASGQEIHTLTGHKGAIYALALTKDGRCAVSGADDGTLKAWDLIIGRELCTFTGHKEAINTVAITINGQRAVSAANDSTIKIWDIVTGECLATFTGVSDMTMAATAPNGRTFVAGDASGRVHFLRLEGVEESE